MSLVSLWKFIFYLFPEQVISAQVLKSENKECPLRPDAVSLPESQVGLPVPPVSFEGIPGMATLPDPGVLTVLPSRAPFPVPLCCLEPRRTQQHLLEERQETSAFPWTVTRARLAGPASFSSLLLDMNAAVIGEVRQHLVTMRQPGRGKMPPAARAGWRRKPEKVHPAHAGTPSSGPLCGTQPLPADVANLSFLLLKPNHVSQRTECCSLSTLMFTYPPILATVLLRGPQSCAPGSQWHATAVHFHGSCTWPVGLDVSRVTDNAEWTTSHILHCTRVSPPCRMNPSSCLHDAQSPLPGAVIFPCCGHRDLFSCQPSSCKQAVCCTDHA